MSKRPFLYLVPDDANLKNVKIDKVKRKPIKRLLDWDLNIIDDIGVTPEYCLTPAERMRLEDKLWPVR